MFQQAHAHMEGNENGLQHHLYPHQYIHPHGMALLPPPLMATQNGQMIPTSYAQSNRKLIY